MKIKDLIEAAEALPVEERALVVDSLLRSLNPPQSRIDEKWVSIAQERLKEFRSGVYAVVVASKRLWIYRNLAEWKDLNATAVARWNQQAKARVYPPGDIDQKKGVKPFKPNPWKFLVELRRIELLAS